jgi:AraC-like DNA-binding protein
MVQDEKGEMILELVNRIEIQVAEILKKLSALNKNLTAPPKLGTIKASSMARRMGVSRSQFVRKFAHLFTDRRPVQDQSQRTCRLILSDEVEIFFAEGAEALLRYRIEKNRLTPEEQQLASIN